MIGIYKIENLINGKIYIGQSVDIHENFVSKDEIESAEMHEHVINVRFCRDCPSI